jgi:hypothetical protein
MLTVFSQQAGCTGGISFAQFAGGHSCVSVDEVAFVHLTVPRMLVLKSMVSSNLIFEALLLVGGR